MLRYPYERKAPGRMNTMSHKVAELRAIFSQPAISKETVKMKMRSLIVPAFLFIAVPAWGHCGKCGVGVEKVAERAHAEIGKPAPDFKLLDTEAKEHKLSDLKGKIVVLEWTNHKCPMVQRYHKNTTMLNAYKKVTAKDKDVVWMAIDSSSFCEEKKEGIAAWKKKYNVPYAVLLDASGEVGHSYNAKTTPTLFVIDKKGVLAYSGSLDDDKYGDNVDARNYVIEAVDQLAKGSEVAIKTTKPFGCSVKYAQK